MLKGEAKDDSTDFLHKYQPKYLPESEMTKFAKAGTLILSHSLIILIKVGESVPRLNTRTHFSGLNSSPVILAAKAKIEA